MSIVSETSADVPTASAEPAVASTYDAVPYSVCAFPQTRPDRLAAIAQLFGMNPAPAEQCHVLELGCASGGNVIPLALAYPQSRFVGIDLSSRQIDDASRTARELNLSNVDLRAMSILDVGDDLGEFDYILVHGVYSWVPPEVQDKILDICSANLSAHGVAYVSYNAYPGWHARGAIREMLWYHTQSIDDPVERIRSARELVAFLAASTENSKATSDGQQAVAADGGYGAMIRQELALLGRVPDSYLLHEHLEEFNEPLYFHQFVERSAAKDLQYLAEAQIGAMIPGRFGPEIEKTLRRISPDLLHMEQYMDFLRNRMFRQTLLCHAEIELADSLQARAVESLFIASAADPPQGGADLAPDVAVEFAGPAKLAFKTSDPLMKAAMVTLSESWPLPISFQSLLDSARSRLAAASITRDALEESNLHTRILNACIRGVIELTASPPSYITTITSKPVASPYARLRARVGSEVVNCRLESVRLGEPSRLALSLLDGQHTVEQIVSAIVDWMKKTPTAASSQGNVARSIEDRADEYVLKLLKALANHAFLIA
jgi:methyltransferase-like protein